MLRRWALSRAVRCITSAGSGRRSPEVAELTGVTRAEHQVRHLALCPLAEAGRAAGRLMASIDVRFRQRDPGSRRPAGSISATGHAIRLTRASRRPRPFLCTLTGVGVLDPAASRLPSRAASRWASCVFYHCASTSVFEQFVADPARWADRRSDAVDWHGIRRDSEAIQSVRQGCDGPRWKAEAAQGSGGRRHRPAAGSAPIAPPAHGRQQLLPEVRHGSSFHCLWGLRVTSHPRPLADPRLCACPWMPEKRR